MHQSFLLSTNKKWIDILPAATVAELLKAFEACGKDQAVRQRGSQPLDCLMLFYGESGEQKKAAASLLAIQGKQEAFLIDMSVVVSKYLGETEKNLAAVFDKAADKNWILFFDEADALFGKRTDVKDSHDKYANQEIAYFLQRIEQHNRLVLLSSPTKTGLPAYILRYCKTVVHFPHVKK